MYFLHIVTILKYMLNKDDVKHLNLIDFSKV